MRESLAGIQISRITATTSAPAFMTVPMFSLVMPPMATNGHRSQSFADARQSIEADWRIRGLLCSSGKDRDRIAT